MSTWTRVFTLACCATAARTEVHTMNLRQAVQRALQQNPEIAMARLDELKAQAAVRVQKDPFAPHVNFGSGLAYTNGFPMSIDGAAPSVIQGRASEFLFNRQQSYVVARTKEESRGAGIAASAKKDDVAFRTAVLFLDAERAARAGEMARKEMESAQKVLATVENRVQEGRALPLESKRAALNVARARQAADSLDADRETAETSLAIVLGYAADDRVRPVAEERPVSPMPPSEEAAVESALQSSKELRRLESQIAAKGLEGRAAKAARLPHVDLVAQYGLFATFNHYQDYFLKYQRNNGEIGVSIVLPLVPGPGVSAASAEADAEASKLRILLANTRNQITADTHQSYRELRKAEDQRDVSRLDLEVAREQLSVNLALLQEGRIPMSQVEESRIAESGKWIAFYDAQYAVERARWNLARQTGDLLAALQ
ncbi:MAG TPA: TolC family protein [Bryobacteraceae bacterium]|nr:TolC family protein [Bryobacteraceae bacterium]